MSTLPPGDDKTKAPKPINAFSLIEVVIAIGIVSFALLGIIGLFSATLKTNKDASAQQEGFEIQRMLLSKMQDTNQIPATNMRMIFFQIYQQQKTNYCFIYTFSNAGGLVTFLTTPTNNATTTSIPNYIGTLYYVRLTAASNLNTSMSSIFTNYTPTVNVTNWTNWPSLPVHATVYSIPTPTIITNAAFISNSTPVISFDFIIPK